MKRILKSRTFLGVLSIVMALVICFIAAPAFNASVSRQIEVVRVTQNISEGTVIQKSMVQTVKVGGYNLPGNVIRDSKQVVGKYATASLQPGDYILSGKVAATSPNAYLSNLDGKKDAVSISIKSFAAGLSGKLESGDIVSLIISDYGDQKQTVSPPELKYVKLLAATTDKGVDNSQTQSTKSEDNSSSDDMPSTLTLLATPEQTRLLVDYETNGKLYAALAYRGTEQESQKYLDMEDQYLASSDQSNSGGAVSNAG